MLIDEVSGRQAASAEHTQALLPLPDGQLAAGGEITSGGSSHVLSHSGPSHLTP